LLFLRHAIADAPPLAAMRYEMAIAAISSTSFMPSDVRFFFSPPTRHASDDIAGFRRSPSSLSSPVFRLPMVHAIA
jgi:hypothetical protein